MSTCDALESTSFLLYIQSFYFPSVVTGYKVISKCLPCPCPLYPFRHSAHALCFAAALTRPSVLYMYI